MDPNNYLLKYLQVLKVGIVARESLLSDFSYKVHKAKKIFEKYEPEVMDHNVFYESQQQFMSWLDRYVKNGINKIKTLDDTVESGAKLFYDASITIESGEPLHGIFIPIPAVCYDSILQEFSTQDRATTYSFHAQKSNSSDASISVGKSRTESFAEPPPTKRVASSFPSKPSRVYRSVSLVNLEAASRKELQLAEEALSNYNESLLTPSASKIDVQGSAGDGKRRAAESRGSILPEMYFTSSASFPELQQALLESEASVLIGSSSQNWNADSSLRCIPRPTTAMPPKRREFDSSLDTFELAMSKSSERIRSTINEFQEFVAEMHSQSQMDDAVTPTHVRSLENLEQVGSASKAINVDGGLDLARKSTSDTSVIVTYQNSLHKPSPKSICPIEFCDWPLTSSVSQLSCNRSSSRNGILEEEVNDLRKELSSHSFATAPSSKKSLSGTATGEFLTARSHGPSLTMTQLGHENEDGHVTATSNDGPHHVDLTFKDCLICKQVSSNVSDSFQDTGLRGRATVKSETNRDLEVNGQVSEKFPDQLTQAIQNVENGQGFQPAKESLERKWMNAARKPPEKRSKIPRRATKAAGSKSPVKGIRQKSNFADSRLARPVWKPAATWKKFAVRESLRTTEALPAKESNNVKRWNYLLRRRTAKLESDVVPVTKNRNAHAPLNQNVPDRAQPPEAKCLQNDGGSWRVCRKFPENTERVMPPLRVIEIKNEGTWWNPHRKNAPEKFEIEPKDTAEAKDTGTWRPKFHGAEIPDPDREPLYQVKDPTPKPYEPKPDHTYFELGSRRQETSSKCQQPSIAYINNPLPGPFTPKYEPLTYSAMRKRQVELGERPAEIPKTIMVDQIPVRVDPNVQISVASHVVTPKRQVPAIPKRVVYALDRKRSSSAPCSPRGTRTKDQLPSLQPLQPSRESNRTASICGSDRGHDVQKPWQNYAAKLLTGRSEKREPRSADPSTLTTEYQSHYGGSGLKDQIAAKRFAELLNFENPN